MSKLVFAHFAAVKDGDPSTIMIGIPQKSFDAISDGKTHEVDLTSIGGVANRIVLFGAPSDEEAQKMLEGYASRFGSTTGTGAALGTSAEGAKLEAGEEHKD